MGSAEWLLPAVAAQGAFAGAIVTDKVVLDHRRPSPLSLAAATSIVNCAIGAVLIVVVGIPKASAAEVLLMIAAGVGLFVYLVPYFAALSRDEASSVGPLFQLVPIFTVALGWLALHIALHGYQWIGCVAIFIGASIFALGDGTHPWRVRGLTAVLMALSSAVLAGALVCLDQVLHHVSYWQTVAVVALAIGGSGVVAGLLSSIRKSGIPIPSLGRNGWLAVVIAEFLGTLGNGLQADAVGKGSASLVSVVVGIEPLLLTVLGLTLSSWRPALLVERVSRRNIATKATGSVAVLVGLGALAVAR